MSIKLGYDTIIIISAPLVADPRDNTQYRDWANANRVVVRNCLVQPFLLTDKLKIEENEEREFSEDTWRVWAPAGTVIDHHNRVEFQGVVYEVRGLPGEWRDFTGRVAHLNFMIRRRVG